MQLQIQNACIYDGSDALPQRGTVLIEGGNIAAVGAVQSDAPVLDAKGKILCPGFVDLHRHGDAKPLGNWTGETELRQGITTMVSGNCGISLTPSSATFRQEQYAFSAAVLGRIPQGAPGEFPAYLDLVARTPLPLNFAAMPGTGAVRIHLKGFSRAPFTRKELDAARACIDAALQAGAPGVSMGIMYTPECFTTVEEFAHMLKPLGQQGKVLTVHIRGEGDSLVQSVAEAIEIADRAGCPLEISHFKACGVKNWGKSIHVAIGVIEKARAKGQDITCDFYPYCGGSTMLTTLLPPQLCSESTEAACQRLGNEAGITVLREALARTYADWDNYAISLGWERVIISSVAQVENEKFLGLSVTQGAEEYGFRDAVALAAHLMHTEGGGCGIIIMSMAQEDVDTVARLPYSLLISDALYAETNTPHPRLLGAFPRFLRDYAFGRGVISPQAAIAKMTSLPAQRMGLVNRGRISPGFAADLLLFDPTQFTDNAEFGGRANLASGLTLSMIAGEIVVAEDSLTGKHAGQLLRVIK